MEIFVICREFSYRFLRFYGSVLDEDCRGSGDILHPDKTRITDAWEAHNRGEPVCFFCGVKISPGDEIVLRKDEKLYHKRCYDYLFTLKTSSINFR